MAKPTVFVGSSSERLYIARAIKSQLEIDAHVRIWNEDVFGLNESTLESLVKLLESLDFAVLVITADDLVVSRGTEAAAPRDNIIFEFGLFMGGLGRDRTFGVCSDDTAIRLPSDLLGVTLARYDAARSRQDPQSALDAAASKIRQVIVKRGCRPGSTKSPEQELTEIYSDIATDFRDLSNEIETVYLANVEEANVCAVAYVRICPQNQSAIVGGLNKMAVTDRRLRDSVDQIRELVTSGFAEAISMLEEKPRSIPEYKKQFRQAGSHLWSVSRQIDDHGHGLVTEG
jgi:hypothetical protein